MEQSEHRWRLPKDIKSTQDLKKRKMDSRWHVSCEIVGYQISDSGINNGNSKNIVNIKIKKERCM